MSRPSTVPPVASREWVPGDLSPALIDTDIWTDEMLGQHAIPIVDVPFVTIGEESGRSSPPTICASVGSRQRRSRC